MKTYRLIPLLIFLMAISACSWFIDKNNNSEQDIYPDRLLWSPQGDKLAVCQGFDEFGKISAIYLYDINSGSYSLLVKAERAFEDLTSQFFSPDGESLYFSSWNGNRQDGIWAVNLENPAELTYVWDGDSAAISPSGNIALFSNIETGTDKTIITILDDETETFLISFTVDGKVYSPVSWSSDGRYLLFIARFRPRVGEDSLIALDVDSGEITTLGNAENLWYPHFSPVGQYYSYMSSSISSHSLMISNLEGHCDIELISNGTVTHLGDAAWSPDGNSIVYITSNRIEFINLEQIYGDKINSNDFPCNVKDE